ncbi:MAG: hypothetical protein GYA21_10440 [Myxococcales bacterium]|nr:hypothetical protein [Myxococcales bacterium]
MRASVFISCLLLASAPAAASSLLETLGASTEPSGQMARVEAGGVAAAYFNPALLSFIQPQYQAGFVVMGQDLSIRLGDRPAGIDIPDSITRARRLNPDGTTSRLEVRPLPTAHLRTARGSHDGSGALSFIEFGTVVPIGTERMFSLGFYAVIPAGEFQGQRPFYVDEREQYFSNSLHFELLEDRLSGAVFVLGGSYRPLPWLSFGAGVLMANSTRAITEIFIPDAGNQEDARTLSKVSVNTRLVPHLGLIVERPTFRLAATAHFPLQNEVDGQGELQFWNYDYPEGQTALYQPFSFVHGFLPWRVSLGGRYLIGPPEGVSGWVSASVLWSQWSAYQDRMGEQPLERWSDTFAPTLGGGLRMGSHEISLQAGYAPSPVPDQTGRTNYVDNERIHLGAGYQWRLDFGKSRMALAAHLYAAHLLHRSVEKNPSASHPVFDEFPDSVDIATNQFIGESAGFQSNNPGYPGFTSDGWIFSAGISLRYCR